MRSLEIPGYQASEVRRPSALFERFSGETLDRPALWGLACRRADAREEDE